MSALARHAARRLPAAAAASPWGRSVAGAGGGAVAAEYLGDGFRLTPLVRHSNGWAVAEAIGGGRSATVWASAGGCARPPLGLAACTALGGGAIPHDTLRNQRWASHAPASTMSMLFRTTTADTAWSSPLLIPTVTAAVRTKMTTRWSSASRVLKPAAAAAASWGQSRRGYAKRAQPQPMQSNRKIVPFILSPGIVLEPWRGPKPWPSVSSLFTGAGRSALWHIAMRALKDANALNECQKIPGFSRESFMVEAVGMYKEITRLTAGNQHHALRRECSEKAMTDIKREVKQRQAKGSGRSSGGGLKVDWQLLGFDEGSPERVQLRMIQATAGDKTGAMFAQIHVRFRSRQTRAVYDRNGKLVGGNPKKVMNVDEVWVFEHGFTLPSSRWRLAAKIPTLNTITPDSRKAVSGLI
eukprot:CAMPEP_0181367774 /NCGR_PEP_ID=MMETSP1106-20121128/11642_1 /TAXON_ID=81844 /ORGANISM="Mantoniella antarctica, Strain SL-175" /LENGTH=411 /DNA_ID=CAMNT_0023483663 /DNA_START=71 /DNA_END=1306 /DNA_ORIENTATION=+